MSTPVNSIAVAAGGELVGRRRRLRQYARVDLMAGGLIVLFWALCAIAPGMLTDGDPTSTFANGMTLLGEPLPPGSGEFLLGTDPIGRDFYVRLVYGSRVALTMALVPNALALLIATVVGVLAGVLRGRVEFVLMRTTEAIMVLPGFLIAMAVIGTFGPSTTVLIAVLVAFSWTYAARVIHGETLRLRELLYVDAARSVGASQWRIARSHIIPHLQPLLIVYFTMNAAFMVLLEAGLSFLGFGIQPPTPSWGSMLAEGRDQFFYPWLLLLPGICLASLCIGFYLIGQGLQSAGRPRERAVRL